MATATAPPNLENPNPAPPIIETPADFPQSPLPVSSGGDEPKKTAPASNTSTGIDDGVSGDSIQKKMKRAERFGVPVQLSEEEKRNSRAERFGTASSVRGPQASKLSEESKKKARAERFGIVQSGSSNEESKKKARLERFGVVSKMDSLEEEKKKARAIRFSQSQPNSKSQQNGTEPIEPKPAGDTGVA